MQAHEVVTDQNPHRSLPVSSVRFIPPFNPTNDITLGHWAEEIRYCRWYNDAVRNYKGAKMPMKKEKEHNVCRDIYGDPRRRDPAGALADGSVAKASGLVSRSPSPFNDK
jgi:hypothetical protein